MICNGHQLHPHDFNNGKNRRQVREEAPPLQHKSHKAKRNSNHHPKGKPLRLKRRAGEKIHCSFFWTQRYPMCMAFPDPVREGALSSLTSAAQGSSAVCSAVSLALGINKYVWENAIINRLFFTIPFYPSFPQSLSTLPPAPPWLLSLIDSFLPRFPDSLFFFFFLLEMEALLWTIFSIVSI